ncbi:nitroreductase family deazaflavin-dependent oxidoreductase [Actinomadura sp. KC345]|uniref:nitroreductase/quinone reductase family protein n=1 Tax=Actinomadura sp. KC345 TaxID=2530371 RepID=UPI00104FF761|nr:nitroreductase/quinone reductase family protein [Actinomadura sp. KC345]TDC52499.1 nitroreductase family deazaflavin-dependent oxidoreductase [Actinomadura sp. KC345]
MRDNGEPEDWIKLYDTQAVDSPDPSVSEHVRRYLRTNGRSGYNEGGMTNLVLTTVGRRSGTLHRTGLFFGTDHDRLVLVASGSALTERHPNWYFNLAATPVAHVQVQSKRLLVCAHTAEGGERDRLWRLMATLAPVYRDHYERRTRRTIPVVVLDVIHQY